MNIFHPSRDPSTAWTTGAGRMAPSTNTRISARLKRVQGYNSRENMLQAKLVKFVMENVDEVGRVDKFLNFLSNITSDLLPGDNTVTLWPDTCNTRCTCTIRHTNALLGTFAEPNVLLFAPQPFFAN